VVAPLAWGTAALGVVAAGAATVTTVLPTPSVTAASLRLPDPAQTGPAQTGPAQTGPTLPDPVQPVLGGLRVIAVEPVAAEPRIVDATDLVKAVRGAESRRAPATRPQAPKTPPQASTPSPTTDCGLNTSGLGAVKPHVRAAARLLGCRFGEPTMYGVAGRGGTSDHPTGLAVDFMVDRATGDRLAACALENRGALGITYVIWRQRINFGSGWQPMEDRGGITANHFDHVHVSFARSAGGAPTAC
jgi:hypothetical protein